MGGKKTSKKKEEMKTGKNLIDDGITISFFSAAAICTRESTCEAVENGNFFCLPFTFNVLFVH